MTRFSINSDNDTPQPQDMRHPNAPIIGTTIAGDPIQQGYPGLEVVFQLLTYAKMAKLRSFYVPTNTSVTITYDDPDTGNTTTKNAKMQPIEIGGRITMYYTNVVARFTRLT